MKKKIILVATLLLSMGAFAQAPEKMSYQSVVRDANQTLVTNQAVSTRISILQGSASGTVVYVEDHGASTNINGLLSIEIGNGTIVSGDFSLIDWANGTYFIQTETDPAGGTNYTISGTSQLMSVPYALYAKTSGSSTPGPQGPAGVDGIDGIDGATGPQGPAGVDGIDGIDGATGPMGPQGPQGLAGVDGIDGIDGATGPMGPQGPQGPAGVDGIDGIDGATGPMGPQGLQGLQGLAGVDGIDGIDGATGPMGPQGPQG